MKSPFAAREVYHLSFYEECIGQLNDIKIEEDGLITRLGNVKLILPMEMESILRSLLGKRISILRTDIPQKQYMIRMIQ